MPPVSDGGTEVTLVTGKGRFVPGLFWERSDLPNVEGVAGEMQVTGHGYVWYGLRTQTGKVMMFLLYARLVPGLNFELTSEHSMAEAGLKVYRQTDDEGIVRGYIEHRATGEIAQLTAYRKLFCLSNVWRPTLRFKHLPKAAWIQQGLNTLVAVGKTTVDLKILETKMGFLHPNDSQQLCKTWGAKLTRKGHGVAPINHIAKGSKVPVKKNLRASRDVNVGEHLVCDPMGDLFKASKANNRALHGVTDVKRRLYFYTPHERMNGRAAMSSVEQFIRWAKLPFSTEGKVLCNGSTIHVDGAQHYKSEFTENFEFHGFTVWVASKHLKLSNRMYVMERMHRTVQARARAFLKIAAPVLRAEGLCREDFYDWCVCHAGDVCNCSPSSHHDGGCPIADVIGAEPTMAQTDQAVPAPWGCCCFPLMSPNLDQKQMADRREPALYMRTLPDGRCLCWRLCRRAGQEKWIKTRDVVFSWAGLDLGVNTERGFRPLSENELDVVDWKAAWEQRRMKVKDEVVVDKWQDVDDHNEEDDLPMMSGPGALGEIEREMKMAEASGDAPLDFSFAENDGTGFHNVSLPQMLSPPVAASSPVVSGKPDIDSLHDVTDASVNTIDLGGELYQSMSGGVPVYKMQAASKAMAAMAEIVAAPWDYPELAVAEPANDCWSRH